MLAGTVWHFTLWRILPVDASERVEELKEAVAEKESGAFEFICKSAYYLTLFACLFLLSVLFLGNRICCPCKVLRIANFSCSCCLRVCLRLPVSVCSSLDLSILLTFPPSLSLPRLLGLPLTSAPTYVRSFLNVFAVSLLLSLMAACLGR